MSPAFAFDHSRSTAQRFIAVAFAVAAISGVPAQALAVADPQSSGCGDWNDTGRRFYLWDQVKRRTPGNPGNNLEVTFPDPSRDYGYAVHNGKPHGQSSTYDLLLIPTNRISGIECPKVWQPNALNLWQYARNAARRIPSGTDIALAINSAEMRDQDQLHIHVSRLRRDAKDDLTRQQQLITTDPAKWRGTVISLLGKDFRALHVNDLSVNPFNLLKDNVAPTDMSAQTLVVVPSPRGGYDLLNSQYSMSNRGVRNVEFLLDKG